MSALMAIEKSVRAGSAYQGGGGSARGKGECEVTPAPDSPTGARAANGSLKGARRVDGWGGNSVRRGGGG
jgi:hypothetical protein